MSQPEALIQAWASMISEQGSEGKVICMRTPWARPLKPPMTKMWPAGERKAFAPMTGSRLEPYRLVTAKGHR